MKNTKGITLIALIITIIVMLILVAVSISVALNTGLFKSASDATKNWKTAQDEESKMQIEIGGKKYDSVEDYLEGKEAIQEIHNWVRTGDTLNCAHCNTTLTIGQQVNYTKTGTGSSSISEEKSGIAQAKANGQSWATDLGVQTIHKDTETKWVVLGAESSNGNDGTNETLLLTTQTPTTEVITMYGYQPYNYAVDEINRMCKEIYGADARGMTMKDVDNCLQYTAPAGMCGKLNSKKKWVHYDVPQNTKISDLGSSYENIWTDIQNNTYKEDDGTKKYFTPSCPEGTTDVSVLGKEIVNGYYYFVSDNGKHIVDPADEENTSHTITTTTKNLIFGETKPYFYWLASSGVHANSVCAGFGPGAVMNGGVAKSYVELLRSDGKSSNFKFCLRAVVSLRSEIPAVVETAG